TCIDLFTRMINVVPKGVTLSDDEIEPWDYKVGEARLSVAKNTDKLLMSTTLRLLNPKDNPKRQVKLVWVDKRGGCSERSCSVLATKFTPITGSTLFSKGFGKTAIQYSFSVNNIDPAKSIGKFWFEIDEKDGHKTTTVNNDDGKGYVIPQDDVLFDVTRSTLFSNADNTNFTSEIVIAVKDNLSGKAPINVETVDSYTAPLKFEVHEAKLDKNFKKTAGYNFFSLTPPTPKVNAFDVYYGNVAPQNMRVQHGQVSEATNKQSLS
ncbi:hypothetical protein L218DRAFT_871258, partial [Marasmius fiardii PR-910]